MCRNTITPYSYKGENMYKQLKSDEFIRVLSSGSCVLLCAEGKKGKTVTPIAWNMPVNDIPPIAAFALDSNHFITELILAEKKFSVCIPDMKMLKKVLACGSVSGRKKDKFKDFDIKYEKNPENGLIKIKDCAAYMECKLKKDLKFSGVDLIIADIIRAEVKSNIFDKGWITDKFKSIHSVGNMYGATLGKRFKF